MGGLTMVIALGITAFLILYFVLNQPNRHWILKLTGFFFFAALLLMIPKAIITDVASGCSGTTNITRGTNVTSYDYTYNCDNPTSTSALSFSNLVIWFYRIFVAYIFIYFFWDFLTKIVPRVFGRGKKGK